MRIMVKGGIWKNTEDEILKAAVMKYGKNQWARISSLLVRKSAKQCKARWYEWLDPSIKKTEWSREEEEKLLHLAKIMPNQWKTIAPIVGRTASQCLEHYEKLLDVAQNKEDSYDPSDDPRRLRPGEIDPNPEGKAAKPDPIDMDEDEKEMLSEARARLANTKGKKAKRKAREKQLEEARRLAALQKRRELKAAGIDVGRPKRRIKGIDYNKEIPFQKKPPAGFYDVDFSHEKELANQPFRAIKLEDVDQKRKREAEEEERQKEDVKKQKKKEKTNLPDVIMQINKLNDPDQIRARTRLVLPAPQLSDKELEEIAKMGAEEEKLSNETSDVGLTKVTKSLLPSYGATPQAPTPLPQRTPMRPKEDNILIEARNLAVLTGAQTPLIGGANPPSDYVATPKHVDIKTPNVLATPSRGTAIATTGFATPLRDKLSINEEGTLEKRKQSELRQSLKSGLQALPTPQNDYNITLPELPDEEERTEGVEDEDEEDEIDASDVLREKQRKEEELEAERQRLRSEVLKRGFPRPFGLNSSYTDIKSSKEDAFLKQAEGMIRDEVVKLITHEAITHPFKQSKIHSDKDDFDYLSERDILHARALLEEETKLFQEQHYPTEFSLEEIVKTAKEVDEELLFVPSQGHYTRVQPTQKKEKLESLVAEFDLIKNIMSKEAARAHKLESKLNVYHGGYQNRANTLLRSIHQVYNELDQTQMDLAAFRKLREFELLAIPQRIEALTQEVQVQEQRERENQTQYLALITK